MDPTLTIKPNDSYLTVVKKYTLSMANYQANELHFESAREDALLQTLNILNDLLHFSEDLVDTLQKKYPSPEARPNEIKCILMNVNQFIPEILTQIYFILQVIRCLDEKKFWKGENELHESNVKKQWKKIVKDPTSDPTNDPNAPTPATIHGQQQADLLQA